MSMHSGRISSRPVRASVEITTTLYELMEVLGERVSTVLETLAPAPGKKSPGQTQDSLIAGRVSRMLSSGRIRFKHPQVIWKTCPEWCR
jgi:hypothetical protein